MMTRLHRAADRDTARCCRSGSGELGGGTDTEMGHASNDESAEIAALRQRAAQGLLTAEALFQLALRLFEPAHEPFAAIDVLKQVLQLDQSFDVARIWWAYLNVYEVMDEPALREAVALADEVSSADESLRAAALFVKGAALRHLGELEMAFEMLEASVGVAGDWVANRVALGDVYRELDRRGDAAEQYSKALTNLDAAKRSIDAERSVEQELFDLYFTGLAVSSLVRDVIAGQLRAASY
jgi:tetratricopeptide (TPR) repeat protein